MMHRLLLSVTAAATVLATGSLVSSRVEAAPLSASMGASLAIEALAPIEKVAFCFYEDGWNGPGFYECGFQRRQGQGWHGPRDGTTDRSGNHSGSGGGSTTTNTTTNTGDTTNNTGTGAGATTSTSTKTGGATYTGAGAGATSTEATTTTGGATTTTGGTGSGATTSTTGGTAGGTGSKK
jgi:hypothetical protein